MGQTPTVRCPRCNHPINQHARNAADRATTCCECRMDPNTIAVATVHKVLFGELTQEEAPLTKISRQPDGSWA